MNHDAISSLLCKLAEWFFSKMTLCHNIFTGSYEFPGIVIANEGPLYLIHHINANKTTTMNQGYINIDLVIKLSIAIIAASWSLWNFLHTIKKEKIKLLMDLYTKYNSREMINVRMQLWLEIDKRNKIGEWDSFAKIWTEMNANSEIKEQRLVSLLYEYGSFWGNFLALYRSNLVNKKLAKNYFSYQYSYWKPHLFDLIKVTIERDVDRPDIFIAFSSGELDWLEFSDPQTKLYWLGQNSFNLDIQ